MSFRLNIFNSWSEARNKDIVSLLERNPNANVIDLGCGDGKFTSEIKSKISCENIVGIDIENKLKGNNIAFKEADLNKKFPFQDNSFDVIVSNQVIEHILYPFRFMKELYRILKPAGYVILSTENLASLDNIIAVIMGYMPFSVQVDEICKIGNPLASEIKGYRKYPHVRIFTWKGLADMMKLVGFRIEKTAGNGHIFGKPGEMINKKRCRFITFKVRK
ncbi:MAG: class I SAM-dependent methyltransferase [Candidatus Aenigmarchaeota archaeon]|nr:class I SAM-dependent methyltransferase [Candidatus Aenigmarchaeota archaeon]